MCIGLSVSRPEAAVADPSRLVINDIFPTYLTSESFLNSAQFNLEKDSEAHGGFGDNDKQGNLAMGQSREQINGVMPLYLFKEHWSIAKRKIQPIFGMMCTLDVMGYSSEQLYTIPFLVYIRAMQKLKDEPNKEINQRMFAQIEQTCFEMIQQNKSFQTDILTKV